MRILKLDVSNQKKILNYAVRVLKSGGLIIYPTETAYALGADAENHVALEKLLVYKGDRTTPTSIAVSDILMAEKYATPSKSARILYQKYLPGPLTVISLAKNSVDPILTAGTKTIGIRIPNHPLVQKLITLLGNALTATSANISHGPTPYSLRDYLKSTPKSKRDLIDLFLDFGLLTDNKPSTVVDTTGRSLRIMRQGELTPDLN